MKKIFVIVAGLLVLAWVSSCDKLDEPYMTVKKDTDETGKVVRRVLLEDYTGHTCVNCPEASLVAEGLEGGYNGRLIVIAVHAGYYATAYPTGDFTANYTSTAGNDWFTDFEVQVNPKGMVNRTAYEGSLVLGSDQWGNAVESQMALPQQANLTIEATFDTSSGQVQATLDSKFMAVLSGSYSLTVCITEDSLISPQKNNNPEVGPTPIIYDYVFMNVLRGSVNGSYGEVLTTAVDTSKTIEKNYNFTLDPSWNPKHLNLVAFISNAETKEIIQAAKEPLIDVEKKQ